MSIKDFEFIRDLGKGSFGSVSLVKRKADDILYAIKKVNIGMMGSKEKENALNEVRLLASINSKQIIGYKEAFFDDPTQSLYIVMEYADDDDLDKKIKSKIKANSIFKEDEIWFYTIQILKGLRALHNSSIMHRDLKSANIFLTKAGLIKIGDLNVGKLIKENKLAITQTGTPYYASPEVWADLPYSFKADIWSLGCIVYEMCCLQTPFKAKNLPELFETVTKGVYAPIPDYYSSNLSDLINRFLQLNPENRPSCAEALDLKYVKEKIAFFQSKLKNKIIDHHQDENHEFVSTIKVPLNLKEINNVLPKTKYESNKTPIEQTDYKPTIKYESPKEASKIIKNNNGNKSSNTVDLKLKKTNSTSTIENIKYIENATNKPRIVKSDRKAANVSNSDSKAPTKVNTSVSVSNINISQPNTQKAIIKSIIATSTQNTRSKTPVEVKISLQKGNYSNRNTNNSLNTIGIPGISNDNININKIKNKTPTQNHYNQSLVNNNNQYSINQVKSKPLQTLLINSNQPQKPINNRPASFSSIASKPLTTNSSNVGTSPSKGILSEIKGQKKLTHPSISAEKVISSRPGIINIRSGNNSINQNVMNAIGSPPKIIKPSNKGIVQVIPSKVTSTAIRPKSGIIIKPK